MSAAIHSALLTVEEFDRLPVRPGGHWELHHGEAVFVTFPKRQHKDMQRQIRTCIEAILPPGFLVDTEYPYRPFPEHELWGADVAVVSRARHQRVTDWLQGSPELAIEVMSPSNSKAELNDKAMTTLAGAGAIEFWVVNSERRLITAYTKTRGIQVFGPESQVAFPLPGMRSLSVTELLGRAG